MPPPPAGGDVALQMAEGNNQPFEDMIDVGEFSDVKSQMEEDKK